MSRPMIAGAVLATGAGLAAIVLDYVRADVNGRGLVTAGIGAAVTFGVAVLLFAGAVPRAAANGHAAQTAIVTSTIGFLSVASAWVGLPFVLGTGGAMIGTAARRDIAHPQQRALAAFAVIVGVGAVVVAVVAVTAL
jgi:hypothetical protein